MFFLILSATISVCGPKSPSKELTHILDTAKKNPFCEKTIIWHQQWTKKNLEDAQKLEKETHKINYEKAKELLKQEIENIKKIQARLTPSWTDKFWDFFGFEASNKRFLVNQKIKRLPEFLEYTLEHFDTIVQQHFPKTSSGVFGNDFMTTHDALFLKIALLFLNLTEGKSLDQWKDTALVHEFDTYWFDLSRSVFSRKNSFLIPHNGYILGGQRYTKKYPCGPEDCTSILAKWLDIPEMGFSTAIVWAWIENRMNEFKDYQYMIPILETTFKKTNELKAGNLLFVKKPEGHVWIILGQKNNKIYVISYRRKDLKENKNAYMIEILDWPFDPEQCPNYLILEPIKNQIS